MGPVKAINEMMLHDNAALEAELAAVKRERDEAKAKCERLKKALHISADDLSFVASHSINIQLATMARKASNDAYAAWRSALAECGEGKL